MIIHKSVLPKEVLEYLDPKPNENFIDCTFGQGGHTKMILKKTEPQGKVLAIDLEKKQIEDDRIIFVNDNFVNLENIVKENNFENVSGILLDLGFSSEQLEGRGLSFLKDEELDMRFGEGEITAKEIVNTWPEEKIRKILEEYGEEKFANKIAKKIIQERAKNKIQTTFELVEVIERAIPSFAKTSQGKHCATRTFQALRIAVNSELESLEKVLPQAISILNAGGRLAIISFHSLEDRIVKNFFKDQENQNKIKILTKKPIEAQDQEILENPRSRSAKLRVAIKI